MNVFSRLTDLINANLNSLLEKAEQPEKMLKLIIQEMEEALVDIRGVAAKHLAEQTSIKRAIQENESRIMQWQTKAELAVEKQREDLAKAALLEKQAILKSNEQYSQQLTDIQHSLAKVQEDSQRLQSKMNDAKQRQNTFALRQKSATARLQLREKAVGHKLDDVLVKFERYEQKIEQIEAQVDAYELTEAQNLTSEIDALHDEEVINKALDEIRQKQAS